MLGQVPAVEAEFVRPADEREQVAERLGVRLVGGRTAEHESVVLHGS